MELRKEKRKKMKYPLGPPKTYFNLYCPPHEENQVIGELKGASVFITDYEKSKNINECGCFGEFVSEIETSSMPGIEIKEFDIKKLTSHLDFVEETKELWNEKRSKQDLNKNKSKKKSEELKKIKSDDTTEFSKKILQLSLEESFFLMFALNCLKIKHDNELLNLDKAWNVFCENDKHFVEKYIAYHYFRSKKWVVRNGLKYAGDFVLYKDGPEYTHSSYIVVINYSEYVKESNQRVTNKTWLDAVTVVRISETVNKDVLVVKIDWPEDLLSISDKEVIYSINRFKVQEMLVRRWRGIKTK